MGATEQEPEETAAAEPTEAVEAAPGRVEVVEVLRGLAALAVAYFHFCKNELLPQSGWLAKSGGYGWLGVHVFFVLSGFVIPLALTRARYRGPSYPRFLGRRLLRLEPPYLISLVLTVVLAWLASKAPGFRGEPYAIDPAQIALHLGYLVEITGQEWLNPVYWSLAIEFQFYLFMGVWILALRTEHPVLRELALLLPCLLGLLVPSHALLFAYLPLFALGVLAFQVREGQRGRLSFALWALVYAGLGVATLGVAHAVAAFVTAWLLVLPTPRFVEARPLIFLGTISYSLYLLHAPIGLRVMNLAKRLPESPLRGIGGLLAALAVSLLASYVFWRLVERPARGWSKRLGYRHAEEKPET